MRALQLIRDLVAIPNAAAGRLTSVWSVGCATGEEPYGLALLCREAYCELDILATDVDPDALDGARRGTYHAAGLRHVPPAARDRWFTREGDEWRIAQQLRDQVSFRTHDITRDPVPRHDVDVALCRDVLVGFNVEQTRRAVATICASLRPGGLLILGDSEWLHHDLRTRGTMRLVPLEKSGIIIYQRIDGGAAAAEVAMLSRAPLTNAWRMVEQLRLLGDTRLDANEPHEAAACYSKALELAPMLADLHLRLALCHLHTREPKLACQSLQRALFLTPQLWPAWCVLVDLACEPSQAPRQLHHARELLEAASYVDLPRARAPSSDNVASLAAVRHRRRVLN